MPLSISKKTSREKSQNNTVYLNEQLPVFIITHHEMLHVGLKFIKETETT